MKLKDDDVVKPGDTIHWKVGHKQYVYGDQVGRRVCSVLEELGNFAEKITRKGRRVSRKEYKQRIDDTLRIIESAPYDVHGIVTTLRGEK